MPHLPLQKRCSTTKYKLIPLTFVSESLEYCVVIMRKSGLFEITLSDEVIVEGCISILDSQNGDKNVAKSENIGENMNIVNSKHIYKELRVKGYNYGEHFQTILTSNIEGIHLNINVCSKLKKKKNT